MSVYKSGRFFNAQLDRLDIFEKTHCPAQRLVVHLANVSQALFQPLDQFQVARLESKAIAPVDSFFVPIFLVAKRLQLLEVPILVISCCLKRCQ